LLCEFPDRDIVPGSHGESLHSSILCLVCHSPLANTSLTQITFQRTKRAHHNPVPTQDRVGLASSRNTSFHHIVKDLNQTYNLGIILPDHSKPQQEREELAEFDPEYSRCDQICARISYLHSQQDEIVLKKVLANFVHEAKAESQKWVVLPSSSSRGTPPKASTAGERLRLQEVLLELLDRCVPPTTQLHLFGQATRLKMEPPSPRRSKRPSDDDDSSGSSSKKKRMAPFPGLTTPTKTVKPHAIDSVPTRRRVVATFSSQSDPDSTGSTSFGSAVGDLPAPASSASKPAGFQIPSRLRSQMPPPQTPQGGPRNIQTWINQIPSAQGSSGAGTTRAADASDDDVQFTGARVKQPPPAAAAPPAPPTPAAVAQTSPASTVFHSVPDDSRSEVIVLDEESPPRFRAPAQPSTVELTMAPQNAPPPSSFPMVIPQPVSPVSPPMTPVEAPRMTAAQRSELAALKKRLEGSWRK